jgi:flagellar protein FliO/FliZ
MSQAWIGILLFVVLLAMVPLGLKWVQRRTVGASVGVLSAAKIVSAIGVGPHQRVVTVEVGPAGARVWLTLGVTPQNITCLHTANLLQQGVVASELAVVQSPEVPL